MVQMRLMTKCYYGNFEIVRLDIAGFDSRFLTYVNVQSGIFTQAATTINIPIMCCVLALR